MAKDTEPCCQCGEDTAVGSPLYSDRLADRSGDEPRYLCSLCAQRLRGSREVHSDEEREAVRRELEKGAFVFGSFAPGGH